MQRILPTVGDFYYGSGHGEFDQYEKVNKNKEIK